MAGGHGHRVRRRPPPRPAARGTRRRPGPDPLGSVLYLTGHGIHLAANSIGNAHPSDTAHLWDEAAGHAIWYAGVALVLVALADTMLGRARPGVVGYLLAIAVGLTWATNMRGASGLIGWGCVACAIACGYGWRHRTELGVVYLVGAGPALAFLAVGWLVG